MLLRNLLMLTRRENRQLRRKLSVRSVVKPVGVDWWMDVDYC